MPLTTQYRVLVTNKPSVVSPVLTVNVTVVVGPRTTRTHVHRGGHVHFSGTVQPKVANLPVAIQKLNAQKHWVTISGTITRTGGTYGKTVRIKRGGSYRVYVGASDGTFAAGARRKVTRVATSDRPASGPDLRRLRPACLAAAPARRHGPAPAPQAPRSVQPPRPWRGRP